MEKKQKKQKMRFTDAELQVIKNTFAENDELISAIRKVMLQFPLTKADEAMLNPFKENKGLQALIRKAFLPELDPEAPQHQLIDLWMSVDIKDKHVDELMPVFQARQLLIGLLDQQLKELTGDKVENLTLLSSLTILEDRTSEEFYVTLMARNSLITHVETMLHQLSILGGQKDETQEQTMERLAKDSSK